MDREASLSRALGALASPIRLKLLSVVRRPSILSEIEVRAGESGHERPLARQGLRRHLAVLIEAGLVEERPTTRGYGETTEFVTNHQRVFLLSEELRGLARVRPAIEIESQTRTEAAEPAADRIPRPCLLLVRGADDDARFPLANPTEGASWTIGRRRDADVSLEYDPTASGENATIRWHGGRFWLEDVETSRNGTYHNHRRLAPGERVPLAHGDLIGVGRSLLLYWA